MMDSEYTFSPIGTVGPASRLTSPSSQRQSLGSSLAVEPKAGRRPTRTRTRADVRVTQGRRAVLHLEWKGERV